MGTVFAWERSVEGNWISETVVSGLSGDRTCAGSKVNSLEARAEFGAAGCGCDSEVDFEAQQVCSTQSQPQQFFASADCETVIARVCDHSSNPTRAGQMMATAVFTVVTVAAAWVFPSRFLFFANYFLAFLSASSSFLMYLAVSFLKSFKQDLQHILISRPSCVNTYGLP